MLNELINQYLYHYKINIIYYQVISLANVSKFKKLTIKSRSKITNIKAKNRVNGNKKKKVKK